jgi:hypothetical protein
LEEWSTPRNADKIILSRKPPNAGISRPAEHRRQNGVGDA